jgi:two-component system chemotaxis response regulator CheY
VYGYNKFNIDNQEDETGLMAYDLTQLKILIVEDNQPMAAITKGILQTFGIKYVHTASNGEDGYKRFCEDKHDIIIADWSMKPVNGIELIKKIRQDKFSPNPYVPVIIMTGYSDKVRVLEARDNGATEFLVKPFTAQDLYKRLVQIIERPRQFVKNESFFGPDRRRKLSDDFNGPEKRKDRDE